MSGSVRKNAGASACSRRGSRRDASAKVMMQFRGQRDEIGGKMRLDNGVRMRRANEDRDDFNKTTWPDAARFGR
jgi:hypothetical protein